MADSGSLPRQSAPGQLSRRAALVWRLATGVSGALGFVAVLIAVERIGWWSIPLGVLAAVPAFLFVLIGVLGDE